MSSPHMPLHKSFWCQHTEIVSTGTCAHGFVMDFDSWASFSFSIPCCIWTCQFYNPRPTLFHPCFIDSACKKSDWLLIHGTGIHCHHQFPPNVDMRNFSVHIIGYVPWARTEYRVFTRVLPVLAHVVVGLLSRLLQVCSLLACSTPRYQLVSETIRSFLET